MQQNMSTQKSVIHPEKCVKHPEKCVKHPDKHVRYPEECVKDPENCQTPKKLCQRPRRYVKCIKPLEKCIKDTKHTETHENTQIEDECVTKMQLKVRHEHVTVTCHTMNMSGCAYCLTNN